MWKALLLMLMLAAPAFATDHFGYNHVDSDSQFVWAAGGPTACAGSPCGLNIEGQTGWTYNSGDLPGGAWICGNGDASTNPCVATLTLPQALVSGTTYYVFSYGYDYDVGQTFYVTSGATNSTTVTFNDRDATTGLWSTAAILVAGASSTTLVETINRTSLSKYDFGGFYITTDPNAIVNRNNIAINLTFPTVMDDSAATGGNVVIDGSFETQAVDAQWALSVKFVGTMADRLDCTVSHTGSCSLKLGLSAADRTNGAIDSPAGITSRVFHLAANKQYSLCSWFKLDTGTGFGVPLAFNNIFIPPVDAPDPQYGVGVFSGLAADGNWHQICTPTTTGNGYAKAYTSPDFVITIVPNGLEGSTLYIDDISLIQGTSTTYAAANPIETIITTSKDGSIYWDDDTITGTLAAYNSTGSTATDTLSYEIYDRFEALVRSGTVSLSVSATTRATQSFSLANSGKLGYFRLVYWLSNRANSERELNYAIIKHPGTSGVDASSYLGIHPNFSADTSNIFQRAGFKWGRSLSPVGAFRWPFAEPTEGNFVYADSITTDANTYGITILGTLGACSTVIGASDACPTYGIDGTCINQSKWGTFVAALVGHYSALAHPVKYWEMWNEPNNDFQPSSANCYATTLHTGVTAMEGADGTAHAVCMGGVPAAYMALVMAELASQFPSWNVLTHCPTLSTHDYPGGQPPEGFASYLAGGYAIWNTETGTFGSPSFQGQGTYWNGYFPGKSLFPFQDAGKFYTGIDDNTNLVQTNFARTIASGQTNYEFYDGRVFASPDGVQPSTSLLAYDFTFKPNGVGYSVIGNLVDKSIGHGNQKSDGDTYALCFDTGGTSPIAALFSAANTQHQIVLDSVSHGDVTMLDAMANSLSFSGVTIPFGRDPVYLRGNSISVTTLCNSMHNGTVSSISDTTAPNLAILDGPRAPLAPAEEPFRMRWLALDGISLPNLGETNQEAFTPTSSPDPDALLYSYKLAPRTDWSTYTANTYVDYNNIPSGTYTFSVRSKDSAGNISNVQTRDVIITGPASATVGSGRLKLR